MIYFLTAWLALAPPPDVSRAIDRMGDPSWQVREAATAELKAMGPTAVPSLRRASRHHDPEIAYRASMLLDGDLTQFTNRLPDPLPCIDCVDWCRRERRYLTPRCPFVGQYLERAGYFTEANVSFPRYRYATLLMLLDLRSTGVPDDVLVDVAHGMAAVEREIPVGLGGGGMKPAGE